jgi:hypothetical protein
MIKSLPEDAIDFLTKAIHKFWSNQDTDFDSWHVTSLSILYKEKETLKTYITTEGYALKKPLQKSSLLSSQTAF